MHVINHNWSATKQRLHPQSVAEINHHPVLSGDRIRQCENGGAVCVDRDRGRKAYSIAFSAWYLKWQQKMYKKQLRKT